MSELEELKMEEENALSIRARTLCQLYTGSAENVGGGELTIKTRTNTKSSDT